MNTYYRSEHTGSANSVTFMVNKTGVILVREFESPFLAKQFVQKCKRGSECTVISHPNFN